MNMKTENYESKPDLNGETCEFDQFAHHVGTRAASSLQRFAAVCLNKLHELKARVTQQLAAEYGNSINPALLQRAVAEADSIAATTLFPGLFLPALAEEKVQLAYAWSNRQKAVRDQQLAFSV